MLLETLINNIREHLPVIGGALGTIFTTQLENAMIYAACGAVIGYLIKISCEWLGQHIRSRKAFAKFFAKVDKIKNS